MLSSALSGTELTEMRRVSLGVSCASRQIGPAVQVQQSRLGGSDDSTGRAPTGPRRQHSVTAWSHTARRRRQSPRSRAGTEQGHGLDPGEGLPAAACGCCLRRRPTPWRRWRRDATPLRRLKVAPLPATPGHALPFLAVHGAVPRIQQENFPTIFAPLRRAEPRPDPHRSSD